MAKFDYPEEVEQRHIDILDAVKGIDVQDLQKLAQAWREGRVVVLPVKQGTRFFVANRESGRVIEQDFDEYELTLMDKNGWGYVAFEHGKASEVFATKQEAERALSGAKKG